jgi:anti-sigma factor RsiW
MNDNDRDGELLTLMYVVLDGEATPEQQQDLERTLAADPAARARFTELEALFASIDRLPELDAPRGFVDAVMAKVGGRFSQPSGASRVSGAGHRKTTFPGGTHMSSNGTFRRRTIWAGVAVAAVAAIFVGQYYFDIPSTGEHATGTVTPAQRYRAEQIQPSDV